MGSESGRAIARGPAFQRRISMRPVRAAVCFEPNERLDVEELEQGDPKTGEARVKVMAAGVCHSDWHIMNGDWTPPLPMVLGHEAAGVVEEVAPGVANVK